MFTFTASCSWFLYFKVYFVLVGFECSSAAVLRYTGSLCSNRWHHSTRLQSSPRLCGALPQCCWCGRHQSASDTLSKKWKKKEIKQNTCQIITPKNDINVKKNEWCFYTLRVKCGIRYNSSRNYIVIYSESLSTRLNLLANFQKIKLLPIWRTNLSIMGVRFCIFNFRSSWK